jgi:hypothetical protein
MENEEETEEDTTENLLYCKKILRPKKEEVFVRCIHHMYNSNVVAAVAQWKFHSESF